MDLFEANRRIQGTLHILLKQLPSVDGGIQLTLGEDLLVEVK